ncbi:MAG: hypothetical protein LBG09_02270 [Puniceicoccales bacterium]|jgi:hypothetical protein|nr:hypothetical protein [Puniceicoccales bacterium]
MKSTKKNRKQEIPEDGEGPFEEEKEKKIVKKSRIICQSSEHKSLPDDPWQFVFHKDLSTRKVLVGPKAKTKIKAKQITSQKKFSKISSAITVPHTPLQRRKATRINLAKETVFQVIKSTLKDYNSIEFLTQSHAQE